MTRILRISHSAVVDEYRERDRLLRERHHHQLELVAPPSWVEGSGRVRVSDDPRVPVHVVDIRGRDHPNLFWYRSRQLRKVIGDLEPELVDIHEEPYSLATAGILRAIARECPAAAVCIYTSQNIDRRYPPPFSLIERRALDRCAAAYPCSSEAAARLRARGFSGNIHVLGLGVTIPPAQTRQTGPLRCGFVGRLEPYKGALDAARAFLTLPPGVDAHLQVIGAGTQLAAVRALAESERAAGRITVHGALAQEVTLEHIAELDVLLIPSQTTPHWKEQFGRVAVQAMAAGAVPLAYASGALGEVIGDAGLLVPEGDVDALARALRRLVDDQELRRRLAARAREVAEQRFSWAAVATQSDQMYRAIA